MSKQEGFARILPSGRAVRWVKPGVQHYKSAREKTADKPGGGKAMDLVDALMPYMLTGITLAKVPELLGEPQRDPEGHEIRLTPEGALVPYGETEEYAHAEPLRYLDEEKMIASVAGGAAGGWEDLNYLRLITKDRESGVSFFDALFADHLTDFLELETLCMRSIWGLGGADKRPPMARPTKILN